MNNCYRSEEDVPAVADSRLQTWHVLLLPKNGMILITFIQ